MRVPSCVNKNISYVSFARNRFKHHLYRSPFPDDFTLGLLMLELTSNKKTKSA